MIHFSESTKKKEKTTKKWILEHLSASKRDVNSDLHYFTINRTSSSQYINAIIGAI